MTENLTTTTAAPQNVGEFVRQKWEAAPPAAPPAAPQWAAAPPAAPPAAPQWAAAPPPAPQWAPPSLPAQAKPKRRRWLTALFVLAAFLIGLLIGNVMGGSDTPAPAPVTSAAAPAPAAPAPAPVEQAPAPAPAGPLTSTSDGSYEVGTGDGQLKPGKWSTNGKTEDALPVGYAATTDAKGSPVQVVNIDGPQVITLKAGQTFETHGGYTWTLQG